MSDDLDVVIIGGGIAGLSTAIALSRANFRVRVFERAAELREVGAGITLWSNAIAALDRLGLARAIVARGQVLRRGEIRAPNGGVLATTDVAGLSAELGFECVCLHRAALLEELARAVPRDVVSLDRTLVGFESTDECVVARFADGSTATGRLLIGADGIHSIVAARIRGASPPRYAGYTGWRAVTTFEHPRFARDEAFETWGPGVRFGALGMDRERVYWFVSRTAPQGERVANDKRFLVELFRRWHAPIGELIEATDESALLHHDVFDRAPNTVWGVGRATLIGDAAHAMTPNLGQGACSALEDVLELANSLARAGATPRALREYEALRKPRTRALVRDSRRVGELGQISNPLAVGARNLAMRAFGSRRLAKTFADTLRGGMRSDRS